MLALLNEYEKDFQDAVARFAQNEMPKYLTSDTNCVPLDLFKKFADYSLAGLTISEQWGGADGNSAFSVIAMEEIAKVSLGPAIFLSVHNMAAQLIERFASDSIKKEFLPKLTSGEFLCGFALTEPNAGSNAADIRTKASIKGDKVILNGSKCFISSAGWAKYYLVFAKTDDRKDPIALIVPAPLKGLTVSPPEKKMGGDYSPIASLSFDNVTVPAEYIVGKVGDGYKIAMEGLLGGRINMAACANGLSVSALQTALDYLKTREQFGKKLIQFQGLQFMVADMMMKLQASRLLTLYAARNLDANTGDERLFSSLAKCFSTDSAMAVTTDCVQLLGGAGYIKEYKVERYMREAKMLQIVEGTNQIQRVIIAKEMSKEGFAI
ncbi:MAG: acyl-CoA dehydrogenase [Candidatus Dadabacteria bacterium]|nr:MAG: acyl-CoA dehydrogenase [Candidatus Dadabacteria bacterium]